MSPPVQILQDLYAVEFGRQTTSAADIDISLVVRATSATEAKIQAFRRFPEYKRFANRASVHLLDYVEIDWIADRVILRKRDPPNCLPPSDINDPRLAEAVRRKRLFEASCPDEPPAEPSAE